ncbi:MAG: 50S ribosomal protein L16 [Promethearchaeota archaeon]
MARRPWQCYSKYKSKWVFQKKRAHKKDLIRGGADCRVRMFDVGNKKMPKDHWEVVLGLKGLERVQISDHCLEAVRQSLNRRLQKRIGRERFHFRIRVKPFHIYRENKMMAFAGADRLQTGMRHSFGKPVGLAARVRAGQILLEVRMFEKDFLVGKKALKVVAQKFCCRCQVVLLSAKTDEMARRVGLPMEA